ncbi:MAG: hypothetical protein ABW110_13635 [Steroidobacteraceae bacterium]
MSSNPLTSAITRTLWPYLKELGFTQFTARKFARERNGVIQQLWVDANGSGGARRTIVVLCVNFPFGPVEGYMDPHGFRISNGRSWNMSSVDSAARAMEQIVATLRAGELERLDTLSDLDAMVAALRPLTYRNWHEACSRQLEMWRNDDPELRSAADENRRTLKLSSPPG